MKHRWPTLAFALLLGAGLTGGCSHPSTEAGELAEGPAEVEAVPVEVATVERGPIEAVLDFSTNLEAESAVEVYSRASRQSRVRQLLVEEGDRVSRGQLLLRLEDAEQRTTLAKVESELRKARREYERQKHLYAQELISEQAFNEATYEIEQLELRQEEARRELSYAEVRSPIAGTVSRRMVNLGAHVVQNQHLFDIVDIASIVARVFVPEKELGRLAAGQAARLIAPGLGERVYAGRVERIAPVVDPKSGTVKVTVALAEEIEPRDPATSGGLRPGLYVDVELITETFDDAVLVPRRALVYDGDQTFLYRLRPDGGGDDPAWTVERLRLTPRLESAEHVVPAAGLEAGDRVVVAGQAGLKEGAAVRLVGGGEAVGGDAAAEAAR